VDASGFAMGVVLLQKKEDGKKHPIAYYSKTLSAAEQNYDVYDLELLAIVNAMDHWTIPGRIPAQNRHIFRSSKPAVLERTTQNQQKSRKGSTHVIRV
jgi:hypothetical protein